MKKTTVCMHCGLPGKSRLGPLTDDEIEHLLGAFVENKTCILEDDAVTLVNWAQHLRMGNMLLEMILDGAVTPMVEGTKVLLATRRRGGNYDPDHDV